MAEEYKADSLKQAMDSEYTDRADSARGVSEGLKKDLEPVNRDMNAAETRITAAESSLSTLVPQVASLAATVAGISAAVAALGAAVKKAQDAADRAQATADSKPGGEGSGGYRVTLIWTGSSDLPNQYISITSAGRSISDTVAQNTPISLAGLTSGSVVTFGTRIGTDNTVQWKDKTNNENLTGRSNFYREYSGFKVPSTTGTGSFIAHIG